MGCSNAKAAGTQESDRQSGGSTVVKSVRFADDDPLLDKDPSAIDNTAGPEAQKSEAVTLEVGREPEKVLAKLELKDFQPEASVLERGPEVTVAAEPPQTRPPWCRLFLVVFSCTVACGVLPGQSVFVALFSDAGVFSSSCEDGKPGCKAQFLMLTGVFQTGASVSQALLAPVGLFFDGWGARLSGTVGVALCTAGLLTIWLSVLGALGGHDSSTSGLFALGMVVCDFGSMMNSFCIMGLIWHFPAHQALILTTSTASYQASSFVPLVMKLMMRWAGITFSSCLLVYTAASIVVIYICWVLVPTQAEYFKQAKLVLGMPLPKPPKQVRVCHMMGRALAVLRQNTGDHIASGLALTLAFVLPTFFCSLAAPYGEALFGKKADGDRLATMLAMLNGIVGLTVSPFVGGLVDRFGLSALVSTLLVSYTVAAATCGVPNWTAQWLCCVALVLFQGLMFLFLGRYVLLYSPPNRFGAVNGAYIMFVMLMSVPATFGGMSLTAILPDGVEAYRQPMLGFGVIGSLGLLLYSFYFSRHPPPECPILLPDDEAELSRNFGCNTLEEVMHVTGVTPQQRLVKMLATTDPEVMKDLIRRIDTDKMMEMMAQRPLEDVAVMMEQGTDEDFEEDEEAEVGKEQGAGRAAEEKPLLVSDTPQTEASDSDSLAAPETPGERGTPDAPAGSAGVGRIKALSDRYIALVSAGDKVGLRAYLLEENTDDMWLSMLDIEERLPKAEQAKLDKAFNKLMPGAEFAKLMRERSELRSLVQKIMKHELDKKIAFARRKRT